MNILTENFLDPTPGEVEIAKQLFARPGAEFRPGWLQKAMKIGYCRAGRIVDKIEEEKAKGEA